ncbi:hypothetical protein CGT92_06865 [Vibrio metoecus]|uniref:Uncharacterized protein n=2 Tax=Vibrio TaxID=662 RepID=A0AAU8WA84_9VIBR|nr:hypothetical protein CEQ48_03280 [Vibrio tarriae]KDO14482.1 hypothetical protein DP83_02020 [Vibrio metoecus]KQB04674.1 hypothetical protein XV91_01755 [Vibrio metoecus]PAR58089.1 hypothetical protein CGT92_06865 [Vibrio metoecus]PAR65448.1 hypothetical protein CGT91_09625 [Vibrio metoecus]
MFRLNLIVVTVWQKTVDCLVHNHSTTQISNGITNGFFVIFVANMLSKCRFFSDRFQLFVM